MEHSSRLWVPEPKSYGGARDAMELENFLFDVEQYFRAIKVDSEEIKVSMATMYLVGDAKLWWRKKYAEIEEGSCPSSLSRTFGLQLQATETPQRGHLIRTNGGKKPGSQAPNQSWGGKSSWPSNSSTQQKSGVGFKAKSDASTNEEVKKPPFRGCFLCQRPHVIANCPQRQMMNAFFDNIGHVPRGEQSGSQSWQSPSEEQPDTQDYEEEDAVGTFPQWCNAVTTQVGNPEGDGSWVKPNDMPPRKKGDVPGKGLMYMDIKVNGKAIRAMAMKGSMSEDRILTLPDVSKSFKVHTDASDFALGRVLMQECHPVAYKSSTNNVTDALSMRAELDQVALMAMNAIVKADSRVAINIGKKIRKALTRDSVAQQLLKLVERVKLDSFGKKMV
ncbi:hypothetical protein RJ639_017474 [Escallonia herrerae]|uniref:Reverse transcriptase/retrotransposon-derived protein RNase H-like domain-containing protein n=1 Tax=Escallonia herrerae TaxID=1293975 RepID=A0AA88VDR3_9ASTE|nr:hypothetical protein RJ639_017474 [Escallonia herrerae]